MKRSNLHLPSLSSSFLKFSSLNSHLFNDFSSFSKCTPKNSIFPIISTNFRRFTKRTEQELFSSPRTLVIHPILPRQKLNKEISPQYRLDEIVNLVETLNWKILDKKIVNLRHISQGFFGKGKIEEIVALVVANDIEKLVINSSSIQSDQLKFLMKQLPPTCEIVDRLGVVLQIFSLRAKSKEAKLQVELAALRTKKPHLAHLFDSNYEQQKGGTRSLSGAGETQLEIDKRIISIRQQKILEELKNIQKARNVQREGRLSVPLVAVVGYTNAGKSALVNSLTFSKLDSKNQVFTSLDPHVRRLIFPTFEKHAVVIDTVGFISDLPNILETAFRSTLEEVSYASSIVHVRDITHPETEFQRTSVLELLKSLKLSKSVFENHIEVWNKIDLLEPKQLENKLKSASQQNIVPISALKGYGIGNLICSIEEKIFPEQYAKTKQLISDKLEELKQTFDGSEESELELKELCTNFGINFEKSREEILSDLSISLVVKPKKAN